jgi:carbonic anhydrase
MTSPTRRTFLAGAAAVLASSAPRPAPAAAPPRKSEADDVLQKLLEGNSRFMLGKDTNAQRQHSPKDRMMLAGGQRPRALIVACSDSRVSPELLFDQGLGDLFVVRVAGNVVVGAGQIVKGSIEYAVAELNVPLVMVLGHSQCGAVKAAVKHIADADALPGAIKGLVDAIRPAVVRAKDRRGDKLTNAIRANVEIGVERLQGLAPIVGPAVKRGKVKVVGATYDLRSGQVTVLR